MKFPKPLSLLARLGLLVLLMGTGMEVRAQTPAPTLSCDVLDVTDGATVTVQCGANPQTTLRLAGVEAPAQQALFRTRAERNLSSLLLQRRVQVEVVGMVDEAPAAELYLDGVHVNASVVRDGMARCRAPVARQGWCSTEEAQARSGLRGLWSEGLLKARAGDTPRSAGGDRAL